MKQTAVEWLLDNSHIIPKNELNKKELIEQAKRLENQQKIEMFDKGFDSVEQLNDDYAIEFALWLRKEDTPENAEKWFGYSNHDILNEFKKEKEL